MITRYEDDPIVKAYESLKNRIIQKIACGVIYTNEYAEIDPIIKYILEGNACVLEENVKAAIDVIEEDKIFFYYVIRAEGNEENPFMDVIQVYGSTYIVIFLDYFKDAVIATLEKSEDLESLSVEERARLNMGNYNIFSAIQSIVNIVCEIVKPFQTNNTAFAMCDLFRKAPHLIAGRIVNQIRKIDLETDVAMLPMIEEEFLHWVSTAEENEFRLRLLGAKILPSNSLYSI